MGKGMPVTTTWMGMVQTWAEGVGDPSEFGRSGNEARRLGGLRTGKGVPMEVSLDERLPAAGGSGNVR